MTRRLPADTPVPMPRDWRRIHTALGKARRERGELSIPEPPGPPLVPYIAPFFRHILILNAWKGLIEWANAYGFAGVLESLLPAPPDHDVAERWAGIPPPRRRRRWNVRACRPRLSFCVLADQHIPSPD